MLCYVTNRRRWILFQHLFTVNEYHTPLFTMKLVTEKHENKLTKTELNYKFPDVAQQISLHCCST